MPDVPVLPELTEIVGAILLVSRQPVTVDRLVQVFKQTADRMGGAAKDYAAVTAADIEAAIEQLTRQLDTARAGWRVVRVAQGYRIESLAACGPWIRVFLERGRPQRLSAPALETLAIIAYRQPVTRAEIEAVRGVAVDQILRNLLDLQLIRVGWDPIPSAAPAPAAGHSCCRPDTDVPCAAPRERRPALSATGPGRFRSRQA